MSDEIKEYERIEPYFTISRDFVQSTLLSYEAIGMIAQLKSHSKQYKIYKTQLYKRSPKNKRQKIDNIWKELEENLFLLSFKKRDGRKYSYQYIYSLSQFTSEEVAMLCDEYAEQGYELHTKIQNQIIQSNEKNSTIYHSINQNQVNSNEENQTLFSQKNSIKNSNSTQILGANFGVLDFSSPKKPVKSTFFEVLDFSSPNSTVENQQLINNNIINNNQIYNTLDTIFSIDSDESTEKLITKPNPKNHYEQTALDEFLESKESWCIPLELQYGEFVPKSIVDMILTLSQTYEVAEMMLRNLMTAKKKIDDTKNYDLIIFERLTPTQLDILKTKISYIFSRLYDEQVIAKNGVINNVGAFIFNTFKNYFELNVAVYQGKDAYGNTRIITAHLPY